MSADKNRDKALEGKLDQIKVLLEHLVAITLYANSASQDEIVDNMHIGKTKINAYVKGMKVTKKK